MAQKQTYQTSHPTRSVVMVTYPQAHVLDVVGPLEVVTGAKYFLKGAKLGQAAAGAG